jgi:hypothetical protein
MVGFCFWPRPFRSFWPFRSTTVQKMNGLAKEKKIFRNGQRNGTKTNGLRTVWTVYERFERSTNGLERSINGLRTVYEWFHIKERSTNGANSLSTVLERSKTVEMNGLWTVWTVYQRSSNSLKPLKWRVYERNERSMNGFWPFVDRSAKFKWTVLERSNGWHKKTVPT